MATVATLTRPVTVASRTAGTARESLHWVLASECPPGWWPLLERSGGGVFHSPAGVAAGAPRGAPVFAALHERDQTIGVAAGVASSCRLGFGRRHFYFPTMPAVVDLGRRVHALQTLVEAIGAAGAADVKIDSFDAPWCPDPSNATDVSDRLEYVVRLSSPEELLGRMSKHHRRHIQRGDRDGWVRRELEDEAARRLLSAVQREASARAAGRGDPFTAARPNVRSSALGSEGAPWGMTTFSTWHGEEPLAAALVGWANRRAFYMIGGSTPAGYECDAAQWMHWRIMCALKAHGFTQYNLGGTPASASQPGDPAHGLYRFKTGFGPEVVACRSLGWVLSKGHARAHRFVRRLARQLYR